VSWYFLWSDGLLWLLALMVVLFAWRSARAPHLRAPWRKVAQSRLAMNAALVLAGFVMVALVDSVHFYDSRSGEVSSALDWVLTDMKSAEERSYSAPFAVSAWSKENIEQADGSSIRDYPRLEHGGRHLASVDARLGDILAHIAVSVLYSVMVCAVLLLVIYGLFRRIPAGLKQVAVTGFVLIFLAVLLIKLSAWYHPFGTNKVGHDVLYQAIKSIRTGLLIGTLTTLVMLPLAVMLGLMAGFLRGWVDDVIQYVYTTISSIPGVLLIAAAILMTQVYMDNHPEIFNTTAIRADARILFLCLILGLTSWTGLCRLIRAETLKLRESEYVLAARSMGVGSFRIMTRHILPNVGHVIVISVILDFSGLVLAEAVLSYIGIGVDPTTHSWGNMINTARLEMAREPMVWWSLAAAFVFMFTLVLAANLFADRVRTAFDPKHHA
jgi:peptide/nickel transport system permease protein